ncbi:unnamed protein product [Chrysodeixis includens]|uniref:Uncharacterized protein n=1 Tax=Chrysodeixis includens TaxID=689277 RepID=A0A9N8KV63_CHRIL|nr:unnamed protein product [Chrysodeixis includens]
MRMRTDLSHEITAFTSLSVVRFTVLIPFSCNVLAGLRGADVGLCGKGSGFSTGAVNCVLSDGEYDAVINPNTAVLKHSHLLPNYAADYENCKTQSQSLRSVRSSGPFSAILIHGGKATIIEQVNTRDVDACGINISLSSQPPADAMHHHKPQSSRLQTLALINLAPLSC